MTHRLLAASSPALQPQLQWLFYSVTLRAFITGDDRAAFAFPLVPPHQPSPLVPANPFTSAPNPHPCNLPIPDSLFEEFIATPWHGFHFLPRSAYTGDPKAPPGDLLRTLVFGPDYGHPLIHPTSGLILSLRSGTIELRNPAFALIDSTRTRGKAALAFAAHPTEPLIAYGDNYGTFHIQHFTPTGFGKAAKIAAKDRKVSRLEFLRNGEILLLGGMGYLAAYRLNLDAGKPTLLHEIPLPVRDFIPLQDGAIIFVNQGIHGIAIYRHAENGFTKELEFTPKAPIQQFAVSPDGHYLAMTFQDTPGIEIHAL